MKEVIKKLLREELNIHDIDVMLNSINSSQNCDCCKYFDMKSLENYSGLEHPLYYIISKRELQEIEYLKPKQYLYKIANGFGLSYADVLGSAYSDEKAEKYSLMMKNGSKAPIGYYVDGKSDQEGRHRASSAMKLGCNIIPVVKINKDLSNNFVNNYVTNIKDLSREELNKLFKDKGYKGISDLDWRELQNYIKYSLLNENIINENKLTINPKVKDILDDITDEKIGEEKYYSWEYTDNYDGRAFGDIKILNNKKVASITQMNSQPIGNYDENLKRRGFLRNLIKTLKNNNIDSVSIRLQSKDTRKALPKLIDDGTLKNPRALTGVSVDLHPTLFDI
jgi:hypothetical protein